MYCTGSGGRARQGESNRAREKGKGRDGLGEWTGRGEGRERRDRRGKQGTPNREGERVNGERKRKGGMNSECILCWGWLVL